MNALNGLDGKSLLIGGALVVGGLVATQGGLLPLLLVGGLVYFVGTKQGWWGRGPVRAGSDPAPLRPPAGPPFFDQWHRQAHAADAPDPTAVDRPADSRPATAAPAPPRDVEVRIPVSPAATAPVEPTAVPDPAAPTADEPRDEPRAGGEHGAPPA